MLRSIRTHNLTYVPYEESWFYMKPDYALYPGHDYYPLRPKAIKLGGAPCVFRAINTHPIVFNREWQFVTADAFSIARFKQLYADLFDDFSPIARATRNAIAAVGRFIDISILAALEAPVDTIKRAITGTFKFNIAYANNTGFGDPDNPKANHVTGENLNAEDPRLDQMRSNGTNSFRGTKTDHNTVLFKAFNWSKPPTGYGLDLIERPEIFWATVITTNKVTVDPVTYSVNRFPRLGSHVPIPLITTDYWEYSLRDVTEYTGEKWPVCNPPTERPWIYA